MYLSNTNRKEPEMAAAKKGTKSTKSSGAKKSTGARKRNTGAARVATSAKVHNRTGQPGATGPAYSPAQIAKGVKLTLAGKLNACEVATACGVKSQSYFRKTCLARIA